MLLLCRVGVAIFPGAESREIRKASGTGHNIFFSSGSAFSISGAPHKTAWVLLAVAVDRISHSNTSGLYSCTWRRQQQPLSAPLRHTPEARGLVASPKGQKPFITGRGPSLSCSFFCVWKSVRREENSGGFRIFSGRKIFIFRPLGSSHGGHGRHMMECLSFHWRPAIWSDN
jgi:hypothetical protein